MNFLEPESDRAVRAGVEAFIAGRLRPVVTGDTVFETKNSRYRMNNGVIIAATDGRLVGSELVGWLVEEKSQTDLDPRWSAGARAVLLDRRMGRHIVVTSATLMIEFDGVLADGSDTRPVPSKGKTSRPTGLSVSPSTPYMPAIPKPAGVPRWTEMAVSDAMESAPISAPISGPISAPISGTSGPPSVPIIPSTPPPRGPVSSPPPRPSSPPGRPLGTPPAPPGRTSAGG